MSDADCPSRFWCGHLPADSSSEPPRACLPRRFCAPCTVDEDCRTETGAICVPDAVGERFCSLPCDPTTRSCVRGATCLAASDGRTACRPNSGTCHLDTPTGCVPCRVDTDCGPGGTCREGRLGLKPTLRWCSVPCGPADPSGKGTCPLAPNGLEMVCHDQHHLQGEGPFEPDDDGFGQCFPPLTVDNAAEYPGQDPPVGVCGNAVREGAEECDDGNGAPGDGCSGECTITPACRFTLAEPNGDATPLLSGEGGQIQEIPGGCKSFLVEGALEAPGDVDVVVFSLPDGLAAFAHTFTGTPGECDADLVTEVREGAIDLGTPCSQLSHTLLGAGQDSPCPPGSASPSACGSCDRPGVCGVCDDDSGPGMCTRLLVESKLTSNVGAVAFASKQKTLRLYARSPSATVARYALVVERLLAAAEGNLKNPPAESCYLGSFEPSTTTSVFSRRSVMARSG